METAAAILIIVGIVVGIMVFQRLVGSGVDAVAKVANEKIFYKSECEEGRALVSEPLVVTVSASAAEIMRQLDAHVVTEEGPRAVGFTIYESNRSENQILYACGSKLMTYFDALVVLTERQVKTEAAFKIANWRESDGMINGWEAMKKLRKKVQAAFAAADAQGNTVLNGAPVEIDKASEGDTTASLFCSKCGTRNEDDSKFCEKCGQQILD